MKRAVIVIVLLAVVALLVNWDHIALWLQRGHRLAARQIIMLALGLVTGSVLLWWMGRRVRKLTRAWAAARKERRIARLTARAATLDDSQEYDLVEMSEEGFVRVIATGSSITEVYAQAESRVRKKLRLVVRPGTCFISSGSHQNMVARQEHHFELYGCSTHRFTVAAACINADRPIPGEADRFRRVKQLSGNVARFLEAAKSVHPMAVQAGVWAITDGYSKADVQSRLIARSSLGATGPAVSDAQVAEAARILDALGVRHRLGR